MGLGSIESGPAWRLTAAAASWGLATVLSKQAVAEIPPLALLTIQLAASTGLVFLLIRLRGGLVWTGRLRRLGALGILNPGVSYALGLAGLSLITASLSVVLWATEPLMILILAAWILREEVTVGLVLTLLAAMLGVGLVIVGAGSTGSLLGIGLSLAGVAACAIYTVAARKWMRNGSSLEALGVQQLCALIFSTGAFALDTFINERSNIASWSFDAWTSALTSGILYYAVAYWFYLAGLRQVPAAVAGTFLTLIPIFGIAGGYLVLGERLTARQGLGALLIILAVGALVQRRTSLTPTTPSIIVDGR
jgi:drug/metabolite transporter (DMT)-like permease